MLAPPQACGSDVKIPCADTGSLKIRLIHRTYKVLVPNAMKYLHPQAIALTIAGSDPSGGAGLQADLKTFQQLGVYGMSVVTLITVQNTRGVQQVQTLAPQLVIDQLNAVLTDIPPQAIKTGALGSAQIVQAVGQRLSAVDCPVVVDPVLVSKHGHLLATDDVVEACKHFLFPHAWLITPNRFEAERLTQSKLDDRESITRAIENLLEMGAQNVLIKLGGQGSAFEHWLGSQAGITHLPTPLLETNHTHGSGCVLAAAICAKLALGENAPLAAAQFGLQCVAEALSISTQLGGGSIHPIETRGIGCS